MWFNEDFYEMTRIAIIGNGNISRNLCDNLVKDKKIKYDIDILTNAAGQINSDFDGIKIKDINIINIQDYDLAVFVDDDNLARQYLNKFTKAGINLINATDFVVNTDCVEYLKPIENNYSNKIMVFPSCLVWPMLKVVNALKDFDVKGVRATVMIGADIAKQEGMSELYNQTRRILMNDTSATQSIFPKNLAFNLVPQVGSFIGEDTEIEWMYNSLAKQTLNNDIKVHANCVLVPAFIGMGSFVNVEVKKEIDALQIRELFKKKDGFLVVDTQKDGGFASITDVQGEEDIFISRIRQDMNSENAISLWFACDYYKVAAESLEKIIKKIMLKVKK